LLVTPLMLIGSQHSESNPIISYIVYSVAAKISKARWRLQQNSFSKSIYKLQTIRIAYKT
jgi:hypothetical protein